MLKSVIHSQSKTKLKLRLGSFEIWKLTNKILNEGKPLLLSTVNGTKVISSLDKAKFFAMNFASNLALVVQGDPLTPPAPTNHET